MNNIEDKCRALWSEVFGDSSSFIEQFMSRYYKRKNLLYIEEDGALCSMLHLVPFTHNSSTIGIVYALATAPSSRSKGYATRLLQLAIKTAKERNYTHIALIPAEPELFSYYSKQGFTGKYRVEFTLPDNFDFGIDDKENQWLTIYPIEQSLSSLPLDKTITLAWEVE